MRFLAHLGLVLLIAAPVGAQTAGFAPSSATASDAATDAPARTVLLIPAAQATPPSPTALIDEAEIDTESQFGIGLGGTFFAYGLSGTYDVNDIITAEAILGFIGTVTSAGGRLWYRFNQNPGYDLYGYGGVSFLRVGGLIDETAIGLSGGVGLEIGLPQLLDNDEFPPIFLNADIGLGFSTFDTYNYSAFAGGSGIHYRF